MIVCWDADLLLADRATLAAYCGVSIRTVRRHCAPLRTDRSTGAALYDALAATRILARVAPRHRSPRH